ncbi:MAG: GAF domain-containing protein [Candidatus Acidiferrales bacterium]
MAESSLAELTKVVTELTKSGQPLGAAIFVKIGENIAKAFDANPDEVAILTLVHGGKFLQFVVPEKLQKVGDIPMTSTNSVAVRTARERRPEVINNFATARHPTVFEAVPLGQQRGEPIQKIMSAPVSADGKVLGVIQVSRKGKNLGAVGPDFTAKELNVLVAIGGKLGACLKLYQADSL